MNRQRELVDILNKWAHEYYVLDNPTVSDKEYDALYDELRRLEEESGEVYPDSPTRRVGRRTKAVSIPRRTGHVGVLSGRIAVTAIPAVVGLFTAIIVIRRIPAPSILIPATVSTR